MLYAVSVRHSIVGHLLSPCAQMPDHETCRQRIKTHATMLSDKASGEHIPETIDAMESTVLN